jgi:hypothetical protein
MRYDKYMPGICLAYTCQIFMLASGIVTGCMYEVHTSMY